MQFSTIREITPEDPATWENRIFLTFDIDWACDEVLDHALTKVEDAGAAATWFTTHDTPLLERIRSNPRFELGLHPNFNPLLIEGEQTAGAGAAEVLKKLRDIVPEGCSIRSHSLTESSWLLIYFRRIGLTHTANSFIPWTAGFPVKPWRTWNDLVATPFRWEDDIHMATHADWDPAPVLEPPGLRILNFHPIHVLLNCSESADYEQARDVQQNWDELQQFRQDGPGVGTFLDRVLETCSSPLPVCDVA